MRIMAGIMKNIMNATDVNVYIPVTSLSYMVQPSVVLGSPVQERIAAPFLELLTF